MLYTEPNIKMHVNYSLKKFSWEKIHISKGQRKVFNCQFSKVNALGKQKSGDGCRKETCLELRQTEGDIKSIVLGFPLSLTGPCTKSEWKANHHHHPHSGCAGWRWLGSHVSSLCPCAKHSRLSSNHLSSCHTWAENSGKYSFPLHLHPFNPSEILFEYFTDILIENNKLHYMDVENYRCPNPILQTIGKFLVILNNYIIYKVEDMLWNHNPFYTD